MSILKRFYFLDIFLEACFKNKNATQSTQALERLDFQRLWRNEGIVLVFFFSDFYPLFFHWRKDFLGAGAKKGCNCIEYFSPQTNLIVFLLSKMQLKKVSSCFMVYYWFLSRQEYMKISSSWQLDTALIKYCIKLRFFFTLKNGID